MNYWRLAWRDIHWDADEICKHFISFRLLSFLIMIIYDFYDLFYCFSAFLLCQLQLVILKIVVYVIFWILVDHQNWGCQLWNIFLTPHILLWLWTFATALSKWPRIILKLLNLILNAQSMTWRNVGCLFSILRFIQNFKYQSQVSRSSPMNLFQFCELIASANRFNYFHLSTDIFWLISIYFSIKFKRVVIPWIAPWTSL